MDKPIRAEAGESVEPSKWLAALPRWTVTPPIEEMSLYD